MVQLHHSEPHTPLNVNILQNRAFLAVSQCPQGAVLAFPGINNDFTKNNNKHKCFHIKVVIRFGAFRFYNRMSCCVKHHGTSVQFNKIKHHCNLMLDLNQ